MTTTWMHCSDSSLFTWYKSPGTMGKSMKAQVLFVNRTSPRSCFGFWKFSKKRQFMLEEASEKFSGNIFPAPKHLRYAANGGNGYRNLTTKDQFNDEPFWLSLMRDVIWSVRYLVDFLVEQPSQLKYIEWPQFQTTIRCGPSHSTNPTPIQLLTLPLKMNKS
ncbi:hypothetical protein IHE45_06G085700 [Dioscorea alata]|uniref:Uncharacterized protein n=2 Tax=Dioscorea alata TaxID=55571 RepID=A0ACB7VYT2_DIOAL|nr:hypothetical protein IHE45_06G085700 [Dioscorea alata]KAH7679856.1 hypothetical protein IHE45_06G085700 [Dioscorea alata]